MKSFADILSDVFLIVYPSKDLAELYEIKRNIPAVSQIDNPQTKVETRKPEQNQDLQTTFPNQAAHQNLSLRRPNLEENNNEPQYRKFSDDVSHIIPSMLWFSSRFYNQHYSTRLMSFLGFPNHRRQGCDPLSFINLLKNFFGWEDQVSFKKKIFNVILAPFCFAFNILVTTCNFILNIAKLFTEFAPTFGYALCQKKINDNKIRGNSPILWEIASYFFIFWRFIGGAITSPINNIKLAWNSAQILMINHSYLKKAIGFILAGISLAITISFFTVVFPLAIKAVGAWAITHFPQISIAFTKSAPLKAVSEFMRQASTHVATNIFLPLLEKIGITTSISPTLIGTQLFSGMITVVSMIFTPVFKSASTQLKTWLGKLGKLNKNRLISQKSDLILSEKTISTSLKNSASLQTVTPTLQLHTDRTPSIILKKKIHSQNNHSKNPEIANSNLLQSTDPNLGTTIKITENNNHQTEGNFLILSHEKRQSPEDQSPRDTSAHELNLSFTNIKPNTNKSENKTTQLRKPFILSQSLPLTPKEFFISLNYNSFTEEEKKSFYRYTPLKKSSPETTRRKNEKSQINNFIKTDSSQQIHQRSSLQNIPSSINKHPTVSEKITSATPPASKNDTVTKKGLPEIKPDDFTNLRIKRKPNIAHTKQSEINTSNKANHRNLNPLSVTISDLGGYKNQNSSHSLDLKKGTKKTIKIKTLKDHQISFHTENSSSNKKFSPSETTSPSSNSEKLLSQHPEINIKQDHIMNETSHHDTNHQKTHSDSTIKSPKTIRKNLNPKQAFSYNDIPHPPKEFFFSFNNELQMERDPVEFKNLAGEPSPEVLRRKDKGKNQLKMGRHGNLFSSFDVLQNAACLSNIHNHKAQINPSATTLPERRKLNGKIK